CARDYNFWSGYYYTYYYDSW
nr:immunoglobulin heavy chain junction region [Macaca mulatta]MOX41005.1 immunoglobulin heavy chain junction region [Macaca mulatta]